MPETRVVHINDGHPDAIYIGRAVPRRGLKASPWANPFTIKDAGSRSLAIADYRGWVLWSKAPEAVWIRQHVAELRGKVLACWCKPAECHGDVLVELAETCEACGGIVVPDGMRVTADSLRAELMGLGWRVRPPRCPGCAARGNW